MQNKPQFKFETVPALEAAPRTDLPESLKAIEKENSLENCIERNRRKATVAYRLTAVHSSRIIDRTASSEAFPRAQQPGSGNRNKPRNGHPS
jgi:hypothetical protein